MLNNKIDLQWFANTLVSDIIIPEIYDDYTYETTKELSDFYKSGIIREDAELDNLCANGGTTVVIPYFNDFTGESAILSDTVDSVPEKITTGKQIAVRILRIYSISYSDLSKILAGADPVGELYSRLAAYWARQEQKMLINELNGVFATGGALAATHLNDISAVAGGGVIDAETVLDTKNLLGDAAKQLVAVAMHSNTFTKLQKDNLIKDVEFVGVSGSQITIPTYLGYNVVQDDGLPAADGVYTTYFFAKGVVARGTGTPEGLVTIEMERDSLGSATSITSRRAIVLHPLGIKWNGATMAGDTPTNAELATVGNWTKVFEDKAIGIVALKHKLVANAAA